MVDIMLLLMANHNLRERQYEVMDVASFGHFHNLFITDISRQITVCDVVRYTSIKQHWLLLNVANLRTQPLQIETSYILSIKGDNPNSWRVEPLN